VGLVKNKRQSRSDSDTVVYSSGPQAALKCPKCGKFISQCVCAVAAAAVKRVTPAVRLEKKGRAGKSVTVVYKLPPNEAFLKDLCATLKRALGTGGTHYVENGGGFIELQGEWQHQAADLIKKQVK
jgi:translation initiation factor 1